MRWGGAVRRVLVVGTSIGALTLAPVAEAATATWTGAANGLWSAPANWGGSAPVAGDDLVFPAGAQNPAMTNDLPAGMVVGQLSFTGDGYSVAGNAIGLGGDISVDAPNTGPVVSVPLALAKSVVITNTSSGLVTLKLDAAATIDLGSFTLTVNGSGKTQIAGTISGAGALGRSSGIGDLTLMGDNTFTGAVKIAAGSVTIRSASALGDVSTGTSVEGTGALRIMTATTSTIAEPLTLASSAYSSFANLLGTTTWSGPVVLDVDSLVAVVTPMTITGPISGPHRLAVSANAGLTLSGVNSHTGGTTIQSGTLTVTSAASLGPGPVATWLQSRLIAGAGTYPNALSLQGSTFPHGGLEALGSVTWTGPIDMKSPDAALETAGMLTVSGDISGAGGLVKYGAGEVSILGTSGYIGGTAVQAGTLRCASSNAIPDASIVSVEGTLIVDPDRDEVIGSLTTHNGTGRVTVGQGSRLTTGGNGNTTSWDGVISGAGGVTFTGAGTKYISNANTYTGVTRVEGGSVLVRGSLVSLVTVDNGARLGVSNNGSVGAVFSYAGIIAPGNTAVRGASAQALVLDAASRFDVVLDAALPDDYSHLFVPGAVTLSDASLHVQLGFTPAVGDKFVIVHNDASKPSSGLFKDLPEGAAFGVNGTFFAITYAGGDGNDIVLEAIVAPADAGMDPPDAATPDASPDAATLDASESTSDAGAHRGQTLADGGEIGELDAGSGPLREPEGCACRASAPRDVPPHAVVLALLLALRVVRRSGSKSNAVSNGEREGVQVDRERPIGERLLERDTDESFGAVGKSAPGRSAGGGCTSAAPRVPAHPWRPRVSQRAE